METLRPVKDDFEDVIEKLEWCKNNEDKCVEIVKNCKNYFTKFIIINVVKQMENIIDLMVCEYKKHKKLQDSISKTVTHHIFSDSI